MTDTNPNPTTYVCDDGIRQRLIALRDGGLSNTKLAGKLGCSATIISQWLAPEGNTYPADISKWERRAKDFLRNDARRMASGVTTIESPTSKLINYALERIRRNNDVGVITGEAGIGKTRGLEKYCEENPTAVLYTVKSWASDKQSVEGAVFEAVGSGGYDHRMKRAVFLANKFAGSDRLLVVDDAHKLTRPAIQWLFDFVDETQCPLGLVGTPALLPKIKDDPQRFSRVGLYVPIKSSPPFGVSKKDEKELQALFAGLIEHHVRELSPGAKHSAFTELLTLSEQVVLQHGRFRALQKQLKQAAENKEKFENSETPKTWPESFRLAHGDLVREYSLH